MSQSGTVYTVAEMADWINSLQEYVDEVEPRLKRLKESIDRNYKLGFIYFAWSAVNMALLVLFLRLH